ncbi:MAG: glycosyltransferase family 39 protein [Planctomycetota bacterium]
MVRIPVGLIAVSAVVYLGAFLWVAFGRLFYPFELEWMGGAVVDQVCRVLDGDPLYVAPGADYVPFLYTPLYLWVSAGVAQLTGEGFLPLRLVSLVASCAVMVAIFVHLQRRTGQRLAAWMGVTLYAGCYFVVDTWYDIERIDSLFVALLAVALLLLDEGRDLRSAGLAGLVMVLGYLTKQTTLLLVLPFAVSVAIAAPKRALVFAGSFAIAWRLVTTGFDGLSDGWFSFYTWTLPHRHGYFVALWSR